MFLSPFKQSEHGFAEVEGWLWCCGLDKYFMVVCVLLGVLGLQYTIL